MSYAGTARTFRTATVAATGTTTTAATTGGRTIRRNAIVSARTAADSTDGPFC